MSVFLDLGAIVSVMKKGVSFSDDTLLAFSFASSRKQPDANASAPPAAPVTGVRFLQRTKGEPAPPPPPAAPPAARKLAWGACR
jgi:hypothetical protein